MTKSNAANKSPSKIPVTSGTWKGETVRFRSDRVIVKLQAKSRTTSYESLGGRCDELCRAVPDSKVLRYPKRTALAVLQVPDGTDIPELAATLSEREGVAYAEPDLIGEIGLMPNDTRYGDQWGPQTINAEGAWDLETGSSNVLLAILDTGLATDEDGSLNHPDLGDDTRYILGTDFVSDDDLPRDDHSHGTHVAGIAAAMSDNTEGVVGINWASPVYVCKIFDSSGNGSQADFEAAVEEIVDYAVANNLLAVLNLSAGWFSGSSTLQDACQYVEDNGMLLCAITHNDSSSSMRYPAKYSPSYSSLVAVGSTDDDDSVSSFSNTGSETTVVAPGRDILATTPTYDVTSGDPDYDEKTGTSMACPHVAGVASLVWSRQERQSSEQVRDVLKHTAVKLGAGTFDNAWGYGRIDAEQAVAKAGWDIDLVYPALEFVDVPESETTARAIRFDVKSFHVTTFEVITGPTGVFSLAFGPQTSLGKSTDYDTPRSAYIWVEYTGTTDGDSHTGSVTVRCVETQQQWVIPISANTVARPSACVMMTLDRSGSMGFDSGIPGQRRIDVLKYSANILAEVIQAGNGMGIVAFDHDPHDVLIPVAGPLDVPGGLDPERAAINSAIGGFSYNPSGSTAIGDGIERAQERLTPVGGYETKSILVLTDGKETAGKYISDVSDLIDARVFAVGMGTAAKIAPAALNAICNDTGGYTLVTDQLDEDSYYKLAKYFLQILAGITNEDIVVDPDGRIQWGQEHKIPFNLTESDISSDVILMLPERGLVDMCVETPSGELLGTSDAFALPSLTFHDGDNVRYYRMNLPVPAGGAEARAGRWHAVLRLNDKHYKHYLSTLRDEQRTRETVKAHGVHYSLLVHAYSNLRMRCSLSQDSFEVGATITIRATLTQNAIPLDKPAGVVAHITRPDGSQFELRMRPASPGVYECETTASHTGVTTIRVKADGFTRRNRRYTREQVLTATTWQGGDEPLPSASDDEHGEQLLCRLASCLQSSTSPELKERLRKRGLDLEALLKCACPDAQPRSYGKLTPTELATALRALSDELASLT